MTALYVVELLVIFAGATYFFAAPSKWKPWIGAIVFGAGVVGMILTKLLG